MDFDKREFLMLTGAAAASVASVEMLKQDRDDLYVDVDLDRIPQPEDGRGISANIYGRAEKEHLETFEIQHLEPGDNTWNVLESQQASEDDASIDLSYSPEVAGEYHIRAVAFTDNQSYVSEVETVEVVDEL